MEYTPKHFSDIRLRPVLMQRVRRAKEAPAHRAGVENDENIFSAAGGIDVFILFGDDIGLFIGDDDQESIGLQIFQLEPEPAVGIRFGLELDGAGDPDNRIDRPGHGFVNNHHTGNLGRPGRSEFIVEGNGKGDDRRYGGEYHFPFCKELKDDCFGDHNKVIGAFVTNDGP